MIIDSLFNHHHHYSHGSGGFLPSCFGGGCGGGGGSTEEGTLVFIIIIIIMLALLAIIAAVALYYMLNKFLESAERLYFNEGWLKACVMLTTSLAFGTAGSLLVLQFLIVPLTALAIAATLNPVGLIIATVVLITIISAGIGCFISSQMYDVVSIDDDAIDPKDSSRFRLTANEEQSLIDKGIDPIKVKCALIALRTEIGTHLESHESRLPSFFDRHHGDGNEVQELLKKVRDLRSGKLDDYSNITVGDFSFDCKIQEPCSQIPSPSPFTLEP